MARIKKAQLGNLVKAAGKAAKKASNNAVKKITVASNKPSPGKYMNQFAEFSDNLMGRKPSASNIKRQIAFDYKGNKPKYKKGGSFPDLNKDGKVTQKDILIGKGVLPKTAKKGTVAMKKQAAVAIAMKKAGKAPKKKMMGGGMAKPVMKNGGKKAPKKMMGGGRCKYGC